ncbi:MULTISPECIES: hypothetical protein [unclassified Mesorhizobium]|nr:MULTISPECIES: hypothetical protein [unclassified Mesorhizobium]
MLALDPIDQNVVATALPRIVTELGGIGGGIGLPGRSACIKPD